MKGDLELGVVSAAFRFLVVSVVFTALGMGVLALYHYCVG